MFIWDWLAIAVGWLLFFWLVIIIAGLFLSIVIGIKDRFKYFEKE